MTPRDAFLMTRRAISHHLHDEQGQGLVVALLVMMLLAILVPAVLTFTATNQRNASYTKSAQVARSLADAGVNNAAQVLASAAVPGSTTNGELVPDPNTCTSSLLPNSESTANSSSYAGGTVKWWGYFATATKPATNTTDCQDWIWTLKAQATVPNPTGPNASPIVKFATAQVKVSPPVKTTYDVGVWNTVYSPFGPTPGVCDTSIGQGITISVPVYVGGNLCMGQNAVITKPVYVGGFLTFQNKQGTIGSSSSPVNSAHVGSYCQVSSGGQVNPCASEPVAKNAPDTNIWVSGAPANLTGPASDFANIFPPAICWDGTQTGACTNEPPGGWYTYASPGPLHPCGSPAAGQPTFDTTPANGFNDTFQNSPFNLTPATSYTCQTAQGELTWNAANRTLKVVGTIFFDGSITMSTTGNLPITYIGANSCTNVGDCQAVIYASGDISISGEKLCAVLSGSDCAWNNWDPNKKILIFASNGPTGVTVSGSSQAEFQGGLYATNTVATGQSATTEGPLVSGTKTVVLGQQFGGTFPPITLLPFSIANPPGAFTISPAFNFS